MFSNEEIWKAIDSLALRHGMSTSRLSLAAGLDSTALNKSKRTGADGRPRWVSTETIAKILSATGTPPQDFFDMVCGARPNSDGRPVVSSHLRRRNAKAHILLVDPDPVFGEGMAMELGAAGYDIECAPDLRHALKVIESRQSLDLLITDLNLPHGAHGRTLARIALTYQPRLKIIFLTSIALPPRAAISAETILQKPSETAHIAAVVAALLDAPQVPQARPHQQYSSGHKANGKLHGPG